MDGATRYGIHRSVEPAGVLPQQAEKLDTTSPLAPGEMLIDVDYLNIDSASWHQLKTATGGDASAMADALTDIVWRRGKMHNPVTGSGGMLVGTVAALGAGRTEPAPGTRIATLVSLTLTPLQIHDVVELDPNSEQVRIKGRAILFASGNYAVIPEDLPERAVLSVLDVCGAPAWATRCTEAGMNVVVIGAGGKSGMLTCAAAVDAGARVLGLCWPEETAAAAKEAGAEAVVVDCTDPVAVADAVSRNMDGGADLVFVCANVPGCEGGAVLACKDSGRVVFFSMATSFTAAALVAEGVGRSCEMVIGNGYVPGHADLALDLVRRHPRLLTRIAPS
ncbi:MAG TPA: zinc-binding dehydrogenase [Actinomycetota bacterium]|nr:zinc-binding dehydrogenase [Actinomycetota bacterium]